MPIYVTHIGLDSYIFLLFFLKGAHKVQIVHVINRKRLFTRIIKSISCTALADKQYSYHNISISCKWFLFTSFQKVQTGCKSSSSHPANQVFMRFFDNSFLSYAAHILNPVQLVGHLPNDKERLMQELRDGISQYSSQGLLKCQLNFQAWWTFSGF